MGVHGAFDQAMTDVSGILHIAIIMPTSPNPYDTINPLAQGTLGLLNAAAKSGTVRRFDLTSSSHPVAPPHTRERPVVDENTFNKAAGSVFWSEMSSEPPGRRFMAIYAASKVCLELAVRGWVDSQRDHGGVKDNYVIPSANFGPTLHKDHPGSIPWSWPTALYEGRPRDILVPTQYYIDLITPTCGLLLHSEYLL
ncbi:hypothetical protein BDW59DRAFT_162461 [Aspergillus cavernicola]|uniref:Thioester reductase (TE) domain-containing protein n=1 Tax=Aspergillus cavernicola TaxID=176166 RepID=A0ABR4I9M0_9EURO